MRKTIGLPAGVGIWVFIVALMMPQAFCRADVNKMVVDSGKKATALVEIYEGKTLKGWASAFCIDKSGVFVTNNHVAKTGLKDNKLTLVIDAGLHTQRSVTATILKADAETDLAILRADRAGTYESLEISNPASIRALTETTQVTVFGYPLGEALAMRENERPEASVTSSRVMALRHDHGQLELIQLDGSINHGNSGGPVVNDGGKVVGIIAAGIPGTAISFAIPANRLGHLLVLAHVTLTSRSPADAAGAFADVLADDDSQVPDPANRATTPDEATRQSARKVVHDLMTREFGDTTPKGKRALGAALFARGVAINDDPVGCYELLTEAADAAVDSGDLDTAMKAAGEIGRRYEVDAPALKAGVLIRITPKCTSSWDSALFAANGLVVSAALVHRDLYPDAQKLIPLIRSASATSYSVQIQKQVREKLVLIEGACTGYALAEPAITKLKTTPNDPQANLIVGRFECFVRNHFDKGLPLLARGADPALKAAAMADLASPSTGPACKAVGDVWWDQAAKETKDAVATAQCKARAGYWYRLGVVQLDGLTKALVQQRIDTLPPPAPEDTTPQTTEAAAPIDGVYRLNSDQLPAPFEATGTFSVADAGIKLSEESCRIQTRAEDFLSKDFIFEASVEVKHQENSITIGLGDGTEPGSVCLTIRPEGRTDMRAFMTLGDHNDKRVGDIRVAGPRVLRIERHGTAVTVSVGVSNAGKFEADMSQTVGDAKAAAAELSEHHARLFISGKTTWTQFRLLTGRAADPARPAPPPPVAVTPAPANDPPKAPVEREKSVVYLTDLQEVSVRTFRDGTWGFGKNGKLSSQGDALIHVKGQTSPHGMGLIPPSHGASVVVYSLGGKFQRFDGGVAIDDEAPRAPKRPIIFRINGDGNEIWRGDPVARKGEPQTFSIDIKGVDKLEIIIDCPGEHDGAEAVWIEPRLSNERAAQAAAVNSLASLRFEEGVGYTVGKLTKGTLTHTNDDKEVLTEIPPSLVGKPFTKMVGGKSGSVRFEVATKGTIYILAQVWSGYPSQAGVLGNFAKKESLQVVNAQRVFEVWSLTADAGKRFEVPFPVILVADSLEKVSKLD